MSRGVRGGVRRTFVGLVTSVVLGLLPAGAPIGGAASALAAQSCQTSGPASNAYTVTVCLTAPSGAPVSGDIAVSGTISVSGTSPGVTAAVFTLDGAYLLTDYSNPYAFTIPGPKFVDGTKTLGMTATLRDGFQDTAATVSVTFSNGVTSPPVNTNTFTPVTPTPAPGQPLHVMAAGDGASGEPNAQAATDLVVAQNPQMFLYLGDVYEKGSPTEFANWYGDSSHFYGRFRSKTNPVVGNHEYTGSSASGYFDYWDNIPHYYSYDAGSWHFIALDSTSQFGQTGPGSGQYEWLANDLAANTQPCTLAYWHHPVYSVGPQGDTARMDDIWALLAAHHTNIVLSGHDHSYQRWQPLDGAGNPDPDGITEFVVGTGGHGIQSFVRQDSRLAMGLGTTAAIGALQLDLSASGATFAFKAASNGATLDSGTVSCTPPPPDTEKPTAPTNLTATAVGSSRVDLAWSASTDNRAVVGYDITRNGVALDSVDGATLAYTDTSGLPSTTYTYTVRARDLAGNISDPSNDATATTASGTHTPLFADGFETNSLTGWTNSGVVVQSAEVATGSFAARATTTSAAAWAWRTLPSTLGNGYYRWRFEIISRGANNLYIGKLRTSTGTSIVGFYVGDGGGTLNYRNDAGAVSVRSSIVPTPGWHELQVHLDVGNPGQIEVWLDGTKVDALSKADNFGSTPVGRFQIGDNTGARAYDLAIDDVAADTLFITDPPPADTTPPSAPQDLTASAPTSSNVGLDWEPSQDNVGVTGYDIYRNDLTDPVGSVAGTTTSYNDGTVTAGTSYTYTVVARDGAGNESAPSAPASVDVPPDAATAPGAPTGLTATAGDGQVSLSWTAPASDGGSPIVGYTVYRGTTAGGEAKLTDTTGQATAFTDTAATNGTTYFYKVSARNVVGEGAQSNEGSATPATAPGAPTNLNATGGDGRVDLTWTAPTNTGGAAITGYRVYRGTTSGGETFLATAAGPAYADTTVTNGTTYYYTVSAVAAAEGPQSGEASATPVGKPGAPTNLAATPGNQQVALSWSAPASTGGSTITSYTIYRGTTSGGETALPTTVTTTNFTDTGLVNGTTYFYKVAATNTAGTGAQSSERSATPRTVPGAPSSFTATAGSGQVALSWSAPAANGGSAITGYKLYRSTSSGAETIYQTLGNVTSYTDTGVTSGTTYFYTLTAVNGAGEGAPSSEANATPTGALPLLSDGFESFSATTWHAIGNFGTTTSGPHTGSFAVRANCGGTACWGYRAFENGQTATDLYASVWVRITARDRSTTNLFRLRTASSGSGASVIGVLVNNKGRLGVRNDAAKTTYSGTHDVSLATWHHIVVHLTTGSSGHLEVWLDGTALTELTKTANFGTAAIAKLQLGENQANRTFDVSFDDVLASTTPIAP